MNVSLISFLNYNRVQIKARPVNFKSHRASIGVNSPYIDEDAPLKKLQQKFPLPECLKNCAQSYKDWFYSELNRKIKAFPHRDPDEIYVSFIRGFDIK